MRRRQGGIRRWRAGMVALGACSVWLGACSLETEPYPGAGGGPGSTSTSITTTTGLPCAVDEECGEQDANPCTTPTCAQGACSEIAADAMVLPGATECRVSACDDGEVVETLPGEEKGCGADPMKTHCDGMGNCTGCEDDGDCFLDLACPTWKCEGTPKQCVLLSAPDDVASQTEGDCAHLSCKNGLPVKTLDEQDPPNENPPDPCTAWKCLGIEDAIKEPQVGKACGSPKKCTNNLAKAEASCDGDGICQPGELTACPPFACDTATQECKTTCTPATQAQDCVDGYCEGDVCKAKIDTGMPCGAGAQCFTGFCADGVCCNNACDNPCNSCDLGGGTPGVCSPLPKGLIDTCDAGSTCNGGACAPLSTKKAVGQSCTQESDCYNDEFGSSNCVNGFCRLSVGSACDQGPSWHCSTRFCDSIGVCAECFVDPDCGPGGHCVPSGGIARCDFGPGGTCGNNTECVSNVCNGASASGPGTCQ